MMKSFKKYLFFLGLSSLFVIFKLGATVKPPEITEPLLNQYIADIDKLTAPKDINTIIISAAHGIYPKLDTAIREKAKQLISKLFDKFGYDKDTYKFGEKCDILAVLLLFKYLASYIDFFSGEMQDKINKALINFATKTKFNFKFLQKLTLQNHLQCILHIFQYLVKKKYNRIYQTALEAAQAGILHTIFVIKKNAILILLPLFFNKDTDNIKDKIFDAISSYISSGIKAETSDKQWHDDAMKLFQFLSEELGESVNDPNAKVFCGLLITLGSKNEELKQWAKNLEEKLDQSTASGSDIKQNISKDSYYKVLGLEKNASKKEIKKIYFKLKKQYHPDKVEADYKEIADKIFKEITTAYNVLLGKSQPQENPTIPIKEFKALKKAIDDVESGNSVFMKTIDISDTNEEFLDCLEKYFTQANSEPPKISKKLYKQKLSDLREKLENTDNEVDLQRLIKLYQKCRDMYQKCHDIGAIRNEDWSSLIDNINAKLSTLKTTAPLKTKLSELKASLSNLKVKLTNLSQKLKGLQEKFSGV